MAERQPKFEKSQQVKLKSGSPVMTIGNINTRRLMTSDWKGFTEEFDGTYFCQWFVGDKYDGQNFPEESLVSA